MPVQTTGHAEDGEHDRWSNLFAVTRQLAKQHDRMALPVRHGARWLEQLERNSVQLRDNEIVVTWTVADAALIRHQLRDRLRSDRIFAAAPRVRHPRRASTPQEIPKPRDERST